MALRSNFVSRPVAIALAFAACVGCTGAPASFSASAPEKPHAPLELKLSSHTVGAGTTTVTLEVWARAPLDGLVLEVVGAPPLTFGPTAAGERRVLVADVESPGDGFVGLARAQTSRGPVGRAVSLRTGPTPRAKRAARVVITPFGPVAAE